MKIKYKWLYKMVLLAIKYPNTKYYLNFSADCLSARKDYNWLYEYCKTDQVRKFIETAIEEKLSKREIKRVCKSFCENICFYDTYITRAKYIRKAYKSIKNNKKE